MHWNNGFSFLATCFAVAGIVGMLILYAAACDFIDKRVVRDSDMGKLKVFILAAAGGFIIFGFLAASGVGR